MSDAFEYIEKTYKRKFHKGQVVYALGKPGTVTGTESAHVMVKLSHLKHANPYPPRDVEPIEAKA